MQGQVSFSNDPFLNNLTHVKGWKRLRVTTALKTWNWNIKYLFLFEERHNTLLKHPVSSLQKEQIYLAQVIVCPNR